MRKSSLHLVLQHCCVLPWLSFHWFVFLYLCLSLSMQIWSDAPHEVENKESRLNCDSQSVTVTVMGPSAARFSSFLIKHWFTLIRSLLCLRKDTNCQHHYYFIAAYDSSWSCGFAELFILLLFRFVSSFVFFSFFLWQNYLNMNSLKMVLSGYSGHLDNQFVHTDLSALWWLIILILDTFISVQN